MKKFLIITCLPYVVFFTGLISIIFDEITPVTYTASSNANYVCNLDKESFEDNARVYAWTWKYDCLKERSDRFNDFISAYTRKPLENNEYAEGDKGGCYVEKLFGWQYEDEAYDLVTRQSWIKACADPFADTFTDWYILKTVSLDDATEMDLELSYEAFNYLRILIILLPPFLIFYLLYRFKNHVLPQKGESIIDWLKSQKKFRVSLIISLLLFLIPFFFQAEEIYKEFTSNYGNIGDGLLLLSILTYPLIVVLSARFITTSRD